KISAGRDWKRVWSIPPCADFGNSPVPTFYCAPVRAPGPVTPCCRRRQHLIEGTIDVIRVNARDGPILEIAAFKRTLKCLSAGIDESRIGTPCPPARPCGRIAAAQGRKIGGHPGDLNERSANRGGYVLRARIRTHIQPRVFEQRSELVQAQFPDGRND